MRVKFFTLLLMIVTSIHVYAQNADTLLFVSDRDGNREIFVINPDGSNMRKQTDDPAEDTEPAWSPDRHQITFASNRDGDFAIYIMNTDGSDVQRVTNDSMGSFTGSPVWSPDGQTLAFVSNLSGMTQIYTINVDGSDFRRLTKTKGEAIDPAWSPDGRQVAYASNETGNFEIYVMNANGSGIRQLTTEKNTDSDSPTWSPDGSEIAFAANSSSAGEVYTINISNSETNLLTSISDAFINSPTWSQDGSEIAYIVINASRSLQIVRADGMSVRTLSFLQKSNNEFPAWAAPELKEAAVQAETEFSCNTSAASIAGRSGTSVVGSCPANCLSSVWGTDIYTDDSSICTAARHAGAIDKTGGIVKVTIRSGQSGYPPSRRNGILTGGWGGWNRSFIVSDPYREEPFHSDVFDLSYSDTAKSIAGGVGTETLVSCPAQCRANNVWGTEIYTDDSSICTAAKHAGFITAEGGKFNVIIQAGQRSYQASTRNGISTGSWGGWNRSFSLGATDN